MLNLLRPHVGHPGRKGDAQRQGVSVRVKSKVTAGRRVLA
jgi:hypothetical protein